MSINVIVMILDILFCAILATTPKLDKKGHSFKTAK